MFFTQAEGEFRRGVKVWSKPLTSDERSFFEEIPDTIQSGKIFILKRNNEVIISQARRWSRYDLWYYIGYVHLGIPPRQLQLRMSWSGVSLLVTAYLLMLLSFIPRLFIMGLESKYELIIPFGAIFGLGAWIVIQHYREKALILDILSQVLSQRDLINAEEKISV
jgi:hypothetical protein